MATAGAMSLFVRTEMRRRRIAYAGIALVVALGGAATIGAFVAAYRTDRAYPRYVEQADVTQLVVNPSVSSKEFDAAVRALPGVVGVHSNALLTGSVVALEAGVRRDLIRLAADESTLQVLGSADGRFLEVDRPAVTEGRLVSGDGEVFVSVDFRADLEDLLRRPIELGDELPVALWWGGILEPPPTDRLDEEQAQAVIDDWLGERVEPLGVERLRIVGFGNLPDDLLPDDLYPRQRLVVGGDVTRRFDCFSDISTFRGSDPAAYIDPACSTTYRYYSLQLAPDVDPGDMRAELGRMAARLERDVPGEFADFGIGYEVISQDRTELDRAVGQTTRPVVSALIAFATAAAIATVAVTALAVSRVVRRTRPQQVVLRSLGATPSRRALWIAVGPWIAAGVGLLGAIAVAVLFSPMSPIGSVRDLTPAPGVTLETTILAPVALALGLSLATVIGVVAWRSATVADRPRVVAGRASVRSRLLRTGRPAMAQGLRSASGRAGGTLALACALAFAAVVATTIFGATLTNVVQTPRRYGWPWSAGTMTGAGYSDTRVDAVRRDLDQREDVARYAFYSLEASAEIDGEAVSTVLGYRGAERMPLPVVQGRAARRPGEVVLGAATLERLEVDIGDQVDIRSAYSRITSARVVGTAVMPPLGPFVADRAGLGRGAFLLTGERPGANREVPPAFTGIRLRPDASGTRFRRQLPGIAADWDVKEDAGLKPFVYVSPVRPPEIVNIDAMRYAPVALAGTVALAILVGIGLSVAVSVRDRRRELAVLRSLGFSDRQMRSTIAWQVAGSTLVGLVVGLPLGIVAGRLLWGAFARQLGLVPSADLPWGWLVVAALGLVLLGVVASLPAARTAVRVRTAEVLRDA